MLHQMFVEGVSDLHPPDERGGGHVVIVIIHQSYLVLEITIILFETLLELHLDSKEVMLFFLSSYREAYWW